MLRNMETEKQNHTNEGFNTVGDALVRNAVLGYQIVGDEAWKILFSCYSLFHSSHQLFRVETSQLRYLVVSTIHYIQVNCKSIMIDLIVGDEACKILISNYPFCYSSHQLFRVKRSDVNNEVYNRVQLKIYVNGIFTK